MKLKLIISDPGDRSVGIFPLHAEVSINIKDNIVRSEMDEYSDTEMLKDYLADFYDVSAKNVFTAEEYKKLDKK